jgi:hypothetical protein
MNEQFCPCPEGFSGQGGPAGPPASLRCGRDSSTSLTRQAYFDFYQLIALEG